MEYTESEKQAALAWADRLQAIDGTFTMLGHGGNPGILAAAIRASASRLKTLEEENARMRATIDGLRDHECDDDCEACRLERRADLKQEAE